MEESAPVLTGMAIWQKTGRLFRKPSGDRRSESRFGVPYRHCATSCRHPPADAAACTEKLFFHFKGSGVTRPLGFATFFLNRTNRSGILNGGIIGGRDQTGPWKIDARYNSTELVNRIQSIASMRDRIKLTRQDALKFLKSGVQKWPEKTLVYLDPPYFVKGRDLYYDFYEPGDHASVAEFVRSAITKQRWIVSYDNAPAIRRLYKGLRHIVYDIGYSARSASQGSEVMFFADELKVPPLVGSIRLPENHTRQSRTARIQPTTTKRKSPKRLMLKPASDFEIRGVWLGEFFEWIKHLESRTPEISIIAGGDRQPMPAGCRSDVAVFDGHTPSGFLEQALLFRPHMCD
jgi:hypothetical protein